MSINTYSIDYYNDIFVCESNNFNQIKSLNCYTEKELFLIFDKINIGLKNEESWETRIIALELLQSITIGDGMQFEIFPQLLRKCHELVSSSFIML